jgi:hypothetical protein
MKISFLRQWKLAVGCGALALVFACLIQSAQSEPPKDATAAAPAPIPDAETNNPAAAESEHKVIQAVAPAKPPAEVKLSPALAEVIKLIQAGVGEDVILAFVNNSTNVFQLSSAEILYLNDLGASSNILAAMMRTNSAPTNAPPTAIAQKVPETNAPPAPPPQPVTTVVTTAPEAAEVAPVEPAPTTYVTTTTPYYPASEPQAVNYFYDSLSPYGSWVQIGGYGWCWQPTVAVVDLSWRPYCHRGRWVYSNCGWYWLSDYSWGWAPFHYGRWHHHPHAGWVWAPGTTWGPAWVSWRYNSGYCGWAPLPPEAHYVAGFGNQYHGSHVGVGFDFGLGYHDYAFVAAHNFCDNHVSRHAVSSAHAKNVFKDSTVINNYIVGNNNTIINEGVGRTRVAAATRTDIRPVQIREHSRAIGGASKPEVLDREGSQLVIHRPSLPRQSSRTTETLSRLGRPVPQDDIRVASRTTAPALASEVERNTAPTPSAARTPRFFPNPERGSSSPPGQTRTETGSRTPDRRAILQPQRDDAARTDVRPPQTPAAAPPSAASSANPKMETPRRAPTFFVRRPNETGRTTGSPRQPNQQTTPTGDTVQQPRSNSGSQPAFRSGRESSEAPRVTAPARTAAPRAPERTPAIGRPQSSRTEAAPAPRLIPNYSQRPASPPPAAYQPSVREPAPVVGPAVQPHYYPVQPAAPQSVAPQQSRVESRLPSAASTPQAAQPAPSRSGRSESAPSTPGRPDRNRN